MDLFPAIDIRHGRVVRLSQGEATRQTVYGEDPAAVAERFAGEGAAWIHLVDLDRAFGDGENLALVRRIVASLGGRVRVQLGGGLRTVAMVREGLDQGVTRAVIGTAAAIDPAIVPDAVAAAGAERIVVGIDARDGQVAIRGWTETSDLTAEALARRVAGEGVRTVVYTDVARDGMLTGPDIDGARRLQGAGAGVIASGGVAGAGDIRAAREAGLAGAIVGRALYEGRLHAGGGARGRGAVRRPMIVRAVAVLALAAALAAFTYLRLERLGRRGCGAARLPRGGLGRARSPAPQRQLSRRRQASAPAGAARRVAQPGARPGAAGARRATPLRGWGESRLLRRRARGRPTRSRPRAARCSRPR